MNKKPWRIGWPVRTMTAEEIIFQTATRGTANNPGLPPALASLLVAQAKHETGNFTSNFFTRYKNAFGYSYFSGSPYQVGAGTLADNGQPIAIYGSVADSTREVVDWIYRRVREGKFPADLRTVTTPEQYAQLLKASGYYGDTLQNYTAGLKRFYTAVMEFLEKPAVPVVAIIALAALAYLVMKKR